LGDFPITKKSLRSKERLEEKMQGKSKPTLPAGRQA
jgi:hypothetical protein